MMMKASIAPPVSEAIVRLHADGSATVLASTVEMGQGARTVLAQIAAEVLAVPFERVGVAAPDTAITPYDQTTSSSRSTTMMGRAVEEAAQDVRGQLLHIAARAPRRAAPPRSQLEDGHAAAGERARAVSGSPQGALRHERRRADRPRHRGPGPDRAPLGGSTPFWEMAVGAAEVQRRRGDRARSPWSTTTSRWPTSAAASIPSSARARTRAR